MHCKIPFDFATCLKFFIMKCWGKNAYIFYLKPSRKLSFRTSHAGSASYTPRSGAGRCSAEQQGGRPGHLLEMQVLGRQVSPSRTLSPEIPRTSLGQRPQRPTACLPRRNTTSGLSAPIHAVGEHVTRSTPKRTRCRLGLAAQCSPSERACNLKEQETVTRHGLWRGGSCPREAPSCPSSEDGCPPTWVRPPESGRPGATHFRMTL